MNGSMGERLLSHFSAGCAVALYIALVLVVVLDLVLTRLKTGIKLIPLPPFLCQMLQDVFVSAFIAPLRFDPSGFLAAAESRPEGPALFGISRISCFSEKILLFMILYS